MTEKKKSEDIVWVSVEYNKLSFVEKKNKNNFVGIKTYDCKFMNNQKIKLSTLFTKLNHFDLHSVINYMLDFNISTIVNDYGIFEVEYEICDVEDVWKQLIKLKR